jgi:HTH-type transcriptional regulator, competence development regulator
MPTFGERIRKLRKGSGLTQREFADQLGIDFTYVSKIENGRNEIPPSEQLIIRMAALLGVNGDELLGLAGQFDHRELQKVVSETPEVGTLLRRLQARQFSAEEIRRILDTLGEVDEKNEG